VLVVVLVLGALGFRDRKETDVLQLICSVSLIAKTIGILEDDDEDDSNFGIWAKDRPTPRNVIAESIGRFPVLAIRIVAASGGDSTGAPRSSSLLDWWRSRWEQCSQGSNGL
jgi:hypothetical protein